MTRNIPPLTALKAFEAAARLGSLNSAAEELQIHRTVVGRHIRNLESWLGVKLTSNSHAETLLTVEGRHYLERISVALSDIERATEALRPSDMPEIRVWCGPGLNNLWLMPRLYESRDKFTMRCVLLRTIELPDFRRFDADVAIHFGRGYMPGSKAEELARPRILAVASPGFVAEAGPLNSPADLLNVPLLHEQSSEWWTKWFQANGIHATPKLQGDRLGHSHVAIEAAALGQGVALANEIMAESGLRTGRLVEVVPTNTHFGSYYFYAAKDRWWQPTISWFRDWLGTEMQSTLSGSR